MHSERGAPHNAIVQRNNQVYAKATVTGFFYSTLEAGDSVAKNQRLGYATDEFGRVIEEYFSPRAGIVLYMLGTPPVNVDETVMCVSSFVEE